VTYLGIIAGAMTVGTLGTWSILLAFVLMMPLIAMMGMMWGAFKNDTDENEKSSMSAEEIEKRKRDRLDAVLRDLSDDDLLRLKQRLSDGTVQDDNLYDMIVGDDGELINRRH
jgi:uncharacterized membrane protein